nr:hypothetical protein BaRGS_022989 [Batillaria attramentaria]
MEYSVGVNVLKDVGDVTVTGSVMRTSDNTQVATATATVSKGHPGTVNLDIPADIRSGSYELHVSGAGGLTFKNKTHITFNAKAMSIFVQTDKAMYKPGQKVNFRVLGVFPDLQLYTGQMDVEIYDPSGNKIKQWLGVTGVEGVYTQALALSTQPVQGDWKIKVIAGLDKDGRAQLTFKIAELKQQYNSLSNHVIKFTANVTEALTGIVRNGSSSVKFYRNAVKLEFLSSNPKTFKPGLDYIAYLKISQPDGLPVATTAGHKVSVTTSVTAQYVQTTTPYQYYMPRTMNFNLKPLTLNVPDNGLVAIQLTIPDNATNLNVHGFDALFHQIWAGHQVNFEVKATEGMKELVYQVLSRGSIVDAGSVDAGGATSYRFSIPLQASMAPNSRIVIYYVRTDGEIVTDSISFDVDGAFQNQVSISMNRAEAEPADSVDVTVSATPQSTAYLLAVDQSVLLLKSGNDISASMVIDELKTYDTIANVRSPIGVFPMGGGIAMARRKRMIWWGYPVYYGGSDANQIFTNAGVVVMTDALVYHYVQPYCK